MSHKLAATMLGLSIVCIALFLYKSTSKQRSNKERDAVWLSKVKHRDGENIESNRLIIAAFMDYTCEYCKSLDNKLDAISRKYGTRVSIIKRHLPIVGDSLSFRLALASECARAQNKFNDMDEELYRMQDELPEVNIVDVARNAGINNLQQFSRCVESRKFADRVKRDTTLAGEMNISRVPVFVVGNNLVIGDITFRRLDSLVASNINTN